MAGKGGGEFIDHAAVIGAADKPAQRAVHTSGDQLDIRQPNFVQGNARCLRNTRQGIFSCAALQHAVNQHPTVGSNLMNARHITPYR